MSCQEFITNLNGLQDGGNFPKELLKVQYKGLLTGRFPAWGLGPGSSSQRGSSSSHLALPTCPPEDRPEGPSWDLLVYANSQPPARTY